MHSRRHTTRLPYYRHKTFPTQIFRKLLIVPLLMLRYNKLPLTPHSGPTHTAGRARRRACVKGAIMEAASDFAQLELRFVDQIQWRYELIRPLVLFENRPATQRAHETHTHPETVRQFSPTSALNPLFWLHESP